MSKEHIRIKRRLGRRTNDYEADYNGIKGHGETAVQAFRNAKRKFEMQETSKQLEILEADFEKTLEGIRI
jgi:hypothetical protein